MEIGDRIGNYTLTKTLGVGGFATVFAAEHRQIGTRHAVKVLHPHFAHNPRVVERFKQEARAQFKMRHPNIVQVTEFVQQGSAIALVMDLIDGETLHAAMQRRPGPWPTDDVMAVIKPVLEAMAYAHRTGIDGAPVVHRDLKPENVLLDYAATEGVFPGVPKVADFGIAKVLGDSAVGTATGARMGTAGYMAPEQFRNAKDVSAAADVWALGMMLWQLLVGRLPIDPDDQVAVLELYNGRAALPRLDAVAASVPTALSDAVAQALAVDPGQRFADALPLLRAIDFGIAKLPRGGQTARPNRERRRETPSYIQRLPLDFSGQVRFGHEESVPELLSLPPPRETTEDKREDAAPDEMPVAAQPLVATWRGNLIADLRRRLVWPSLWLVLPAMAMAFAKSCNSPGRVHQAVAVRAKTQVAEAPSARFDRPVAKTEVSDPAENSRNATVYRDNGDGTVWDPALRLTWQRGDSGQSLNWAQGRSYCASLPLANGGWRLPSVFELVSLVDKSQPVGSQIAAVFQNSAPLLWAASPHEPSQPDYAWVVFFAYGVASGAEVTQGFRVRCVR